MSCSDNAGLLTAGDIEAFVYQDPSRPNSDPLETPRAEPTLAKPNGRSNEQDLPQLLAQARAQGIAEGEQRARAACEELLGQERTRISETLAAFQQQKTDYYSKVEIQLVHFALGIAAKILHREAQVDRMVVAGLVKVMLDKLQKGSRMAVRVRPEEVGSWRNYFHDNPDLQIIDDASLEPRDCVLETELGTTELGLDAQLKEVEKGFADLLAQRPEAQ
jgi:flagellar assembly protein FliH